MCGNRGRPPRRRACHRNRGDRFIVSFAYGRRGYTLKAGSKTPQPVGLVEAERIHSKLVASKLAKGYRPGADATAYRAITTEPADTGVHPQLANPVGEEALEG